MNYRAGSVIKETMKHVSVNSANKQEQESVGASTERSPELITWAELLPAKIHRSPKFTVPVEVIAELQAAYRD